MPAKGQDMTTASPRISLFLARLIGPVVLAVAIGVLANGAVYRGLSEEFVRSPALIYITGILGMSVGVAILLNHNVWAADWRVLITIFGWLAAIGGAQRILWPQATGGPRRLFLPDPTSHVRPLIVQPLIRALS